MRPFVIDIDPADESLTGYASNVTGASFTLTANVATDGLAHQVSIRNDSATDHTGKTMTLVGTDSNGRAQTEAIAGPNNAATVESTLYFKTLTSVTPSSSIGADTFDIGWVDEVITAIIPLDAVSFNTATLFVDVTGTINYTVRETFSDVLNGETPQWFNISALTAKTADLESNVTLGATALQLIVSSYSSTAELQLFVSQAPNPL